MSEITSAPETFVEYQPKTWINGESITAEKLNRIETGLAHLSTQISDALSVDIDDGTSSSQETNLSAASSLAEKIASVANGLDDTFLKTATAQEEFLNKSNSAVADEDTRTMVGDLIISKTQPSIYFRKENSLETVGSIYSVVDSNSKNRIAISQRLDGSAGAEGYFLPVPTAHDSWTTYEILTTKTQPQALNYSNFSLSSLTSNITTTINSLYKWGPFVYLDITFTNNTGSAITSFSAATGTTSSNSLKPLGRVTGAAFNTSGTSIAVLGLTNAASSNLLIRLLGGSWPNGGTLRFSLYFFANL